MENGLMQSKIVWTSCCPPSNIFSTKWYPLFTLTLDLTYIPDDPMQHITPKEIKFKLKKKLNPEKAHGHDLVTARIL